MTKKILLILSLLLAIASCKKEDLAKPSKAIGKLKSPFAKLDSISNAIMKNKSK